MVTVALTKPVEGPYRVRIPQLSGIEYAFIRDDHGNMVVKVDDAHVRFFAADSETYKGLYPDNKSYRLKPNPGRRPNPPVRVMAPPKDIPPGAAGDREDIRIAKETPDAISNSDLTKWAARRKIAWRNKIQIADYVRKTSGVVIDTGARVTPMAALRTAYGLTREAR